MVDRRIHLDKNKVGLVKNLLAEGEKGLFSSMADVVAFSASLGLANNRKVKVNEKSLRKPDPIRHSIFQNSGYDTLINLAAIWDMNDAKVLACTDKMEEYRVIAFEEYANGGLEILQEKLKGSPDYMQAVMLIIADERKKQEETASGVKEIDITEYTI